MTQLGDIFDMADTWNAAGTTFTAIKMNVTDTASAAASLLMDLQIGGSSRAKIDKNGSVTLGGANTNGFLNYYWGAQKFGLDFSGSARGMQLYGWGNYLALFQGGYSNSPRSQLSGPFSISTDGQNPGTNAAVLSSDAADALAQRNGVNAQISRLYNTYTDASNYERLAIGWAGNVLSIKPEAAGTGSVRPLHISGLPTSDPAIAGVLWNDAGAIKASAG